MDYTNLFMMLFAICHTLNGAPLKKALESDSQLILGLAYFLFQIPSLHSWNWFFPTM